MSVKRRNKPRDLRRMIDAARSRSKCTDLSDLDRHLLSRLAFYLEKAMAKGFRGDATSASKGGDDGERD